MSELDVAISFIQIIAFFLPAWAIMVQVMVKLFKQTDLTERRSLIPFYSIGFTTAAASLYLFTRAAFEITVFFSNSGYLSSDPNLRLAADFISIGGLAFTTLGIMILFQSTCKETDYKTLWHVSIVAVVFLFISYVGWIIKNPFVTMVGALLVLILDYVYMYWKDIYKENPRPWRSYR